MGIAYRDKKVVGVFVRFHSPLPVRCELKVFVLSQKQYQVEKKLSEVNVDEGPHVWTLSRGTYSTRVEAQRWHEHYTLNIVPRWTHRLLANVDSTVMSLRSQKLNRQATPSAS
jgi:hypothetical protein